MCAVLASSLPVITEEMLDLFLAREQLIRDDYQRDAVYAAEQHAVENLLDWHGIYPRDIDPEQLQEFARAALTAAGWSGGPAPTFELAVPDDHERSGWHAGATGIIHLDPRLLSPFTVLHELAHRLRPDGPSHGPMFCAFHVGLVHAALGQDAAQELLDAFAEHEVEVDATYMT
jgi:hypothetical protein